MYKRVVLNNIFYISIFLMFGFILYTNPFLHYPYDVFAHLIAIDEVYHGAEITTTSIQTERLLWHKIWAAIFHILHIDSKQFFLRAKIIHVAQTGISVLSIYFFSKVVLRNIYRGIDFYSLRYLSLWAVVLWLSMYATYSVNYHQVWIMWYSINYQITLPLFFYITGLTLVLFLEHRTYWVRLFFGFQIIVISLFIMKVHIMEFMYYLMYILVLSLLYFNTIIISIKKYYYIVLIMIGTIFYYIKYYQVEQPKLFYYFAIDKISLLYMDILEKGLLLISGKNRAVSAINEMMYLSLFVGLLLFLWIVYRFYTDKKNLINIKLFMFVVITSLFIFIPLNQFTSGFFGLLTRVGVVNRIFYSASLFLLLPVSIYYFIQFFKINKIAIHFIFIGILLGIYIFSRYVPLVNHNYYKNIQSIENSFNIEKVGFHLSNNDIYWIGKKLEFYEKSINTKKTIKYYARSDIAFVIKYIYHKEVYWRGRRIRIDWDRAHLKNKKDLSYEHIVFKIPENFPIYKPYM